MSQRNQNQVDKTLSDLHDYRRNAQTAIMQITTLHQQNQKDTDEWEVAKADLHSACVNYYMMLKPYLIESGIYLNEDEYIVELEDGSEFRVHQLDDFILQEIEDKKKKKKPGEKAKTVKETNPKTLPVPLAKASVDYLNEKMVQLTSQTDVSQKSKKNLSEEDIDYDADTDNNIDDNTEE